MHLAFMPISSAFNNIPQIRRFVEGSSSDVTFADIYEMPEDRCAVRCVYFRMELVAVNVQRHMLISLQHTIVGLRRLDKTW